MWFGLAILVTASGKSARGRVKAHGPRPARLGAERAPQAAMGDLVGRIAHKTNASNPSGSALGPGDGKQATRHLRLMRASSRSTSPEIALCLGRIKSHQPLATQGCVPSAKSSI
ncbi:hypothetical protein PVAP13_6NG297600 [Panicum virgatum]|uniref:Uncharacterized protein n=1 Tax=Panicum virgatum TaxID=38727 RepID=A0A8T0R3P0_PANVG|nr:hypothetical protein PVAP13_6NG297600 [Panicum virgatum]